MIGSNKHKSRFTQMLLEWNAQANQRIMPWKGEKDPYKIWLSEVILQQTRVAQGLKYYENFISRFPEIHALAEAPQDEVFKLWEGLGYYSRCRNLITTAKFISKELNGKFPDQYEAILSLKGIGRYTAAAISSFAYELPYAVVDGNVLRVLSRITGTAIPVDSNEGKKFFSGMAMELLPADKPGEYNQAIMDFGATVCTPRPACSICFYKNYCRAFKEKRQLELPVKVKITRTRKRYFHYFYSISGKYIAIAQRTSKDIWQHLYEFPFIESDKPVHNEKAQELFKNKFSVENVSFEYERESIKQKLSHQDLCFNFHKVVFNKKQRLLGFNWVAIKDIGDYPFPKTLAMFLKEELAG
jgi:A/G-specific adenine glycosylase